MSKYKHILALDVGATGIKLAEFGQLKDGGLELVRYSKRDIAVDPHDDDNRMAFVINAVAEVVDDLGVHPGPVLLAVSGQSVFSRYVKLPPVDPDKIEKIVQYEAAQNVPFPMSEVKSSLNFNGISGPVEGGRITQ